MDFESHSRNIFTSLFTSSSEKFCGKEKNFKSRI